MAEAEFLRKAYEKSTLPFIRIDYETGGGLDEVKQWISGRLCAFCGNSGVGKSTLLNHLLPEAERETSAISQKLGRGRHTTREVTIFEAFGGRIAGTSPRKIWSMRSRSSGLIWASASSPAAPTAAKKAVPCAPHWPRAGSPRPGTTATAPCTRKSRT